MAYEWNEKRARRARVRKIAAVAVWVAAVVGLPTSMVMAFAPPQSKATNARAIGHQTVVASSK